MLFALAYLLTGFTKPAEPPTKCYNGRASGVMVRVIRVNLADPRVRVGVELAKGMPHGAEDFSTFMARTHPVAAVDGAFASKQTLSPIGDIVVHGKVVYRGCMGTAFALTKDKETLICRTKRARTRDWTGYETVLACGPALVLNGKWDVRAKEEGFHDPHVMRATPRIGIAVTADRHLLLVSTRTAVTLGKWGKIMLALNAQDAMNLDAGASTGMFYEGKTLLRPSRRITNVLAIYVDKSRPKPVFITRRADPPAANTNVTPLPVVPPADTQAKR